VCWSHGGSGGEVRVRGCGYSRGLVVRRILAAGHLRTNARSGCVSKGLVLLRLFGLRVFEETFVVAAKECRRIQFVRPSTLVWEKALLGVVIAKHIFPFLIQVLPLLCLWLIRWALLLGFRLLDGLFQGHEAGTGRGQIQGVQDIHGRLALHRGRMEIVVLLGGPIGADIAEKVILFPDCFFCKQVPPCLALAFLCYVLLGWWDER
jgi:hypothetical protein